MRRLHKDNRARSLQPHPGEAIQSIHMTLAKAQSSIEDDESVELKPKAIRLREKPLDPIERKRDERRKEAERV